MHSWVYLPNGIFDSGKAEGGKKVLPFELYSARSQTVVFDL
jgi:hypothetical protein